MSKEERKIVSDARLALKSAIDSLEYRWLFCHDCEHKIISGINSWKWDDCACCITYNDVETCGCHCHERIEELDRMFTSAFVSLVKKEKAVAKEE